VTCNKSNPRPGQRKPDSSHPRFYFKNFLPQRLPPVGARCRTLPIYCWRQRLFQPARFFAIQKRKGKAIGPDGDNYEEREASQR
jgi:hypothetical protein